MVTFVVAVVLNFDIKKLFNFYNSSAMNISFYLAFSYFNTPKIG